MEIDVEQIEEYVKRQQEPEPFSGVVYLTKGREILLSQGHGLAIRPESIPNRANTRFQMASGCKIFTSVAICRLVDLGQLHFDTPLRACVDVDFPHYDPDITIHHLLTHSSGITSYFEEDIDPNYEVLWRDVPMYKMRAPRDFLPLFQHKPMKFLPGERFEYNDGGFILLGLIIEEATGMRFASYIEDTIFDRADMADSGYFATDQLPARSALAYIRDADGRWRTNFFAVPVVGGADGGAYTTAPDMVKFWRALTEHRLLSMQMTERLLQPHMVTGSKPPYTHYGYGVWIDQEAGPVRKYFVEGYDPGVALRSAFYPDSELVLTMIGNTGDALWPLYRNVESCLAAPETPPIAG